MGIRSPMQTPQLQVGESNWSILARYYVTNEADVDARKRDGPKFGNVLEYRWHMGDQSLDGSIFKKYALTPLFRDVTVITHSNQRGRHPRALPRPRSLLCPVKIASRLVANSIIACAPFNPPHDQLSTA
ncbi:hypothetical protein WN51_00863 [Melipona quadrifasciata]|uniref:Uncharacterized protein n=1 Tax=Melipona quadrifasciata TaxID=166423 RepID=A0A0M9AB55_9HYME|nr:hypothetical protein WN51_00863 [Melipona quadrifasciata]